MGLIHIPFLKGQDQTVDPKIAPLGVLKSAKNVRFGREGRVVKRPGFDAHGLLSTDGVDITGPSFAFLNFAFAGVSALFARGSERVAIAGHHACSWSETLQRWRDCNPVSVWSAPERKSLGRNLPGTAQRPSVAYNANGYLCVCFESTASGTTRVYAGIYDAATLSLIRFDELAGTNLRRPRVVSMGNYFAFVCCDATPVLKFSRLDTTNIGAGWSAFVTINTGFAVSAEPFDLCEYDSTRAFLVHTAAGQFILAQISNTGALGPAGSHPFAGAGPAPTVFADTTVNRVMVGWVAAGGNLTVFSCDQNISGVNRIGPTVVSGALYVGAPAIGLCDITPAAFYVWCATDDVAAFEPGTARVGVNHTTNVQLSNRVYSSQLASKPVRVGNQDWAWVVNKSSFDRAFFLYNAELPQPFTVVARGQAAAQTSFANHLSAFVTYSSGGRTFAVWVAPVVAGKDASAATPLLATDLVRVEFGGTERFQGATIGGNLYFSGGLLTVFDGSLAYESGFLETPQILAATPGVGGSMTPSSTYQYLLTNHWLDANGKEHISGVSDPFSVSLAAGQSNVTVTWRTPVQSWRRAVYLTTVPNAPDFMVRQHLWRTEGNGQIFYQLTDELGVATAVPSPLTSFPTSTFTRPDTAADSAINSKETVYTQGARGALSGPLQHDPPPPCRYLWAGKERAIIGGLETPEEVRWSKFYFPGEPLEFSEDVAFRKQVQGSVKAVAMLDDVSVAFTDTQIFIVTGAGPDDTGAGGFDEPKALPSDVGILTWRSLVEWSGGLFFQGKTDMLYLLPRGVSSPQPQFATQEPLRLYPTITGAKLLIEQNLVVFTLTGGAGGTGALLCYDVQNGQWTVDSIAGGVEHITSAVVGTKLLLGATTAIDLENDASYADRGQFFSVLLETAWLRPHGMQTDGRTRKVAVLGEQRANCSLKVELAVNDSQTYAYSKTWSLPVSGGAFGVSGDAVRREWDLPVQKFGSCALRLTEVQNSGALNEGFVLHGITLDTRPRPGMPRLKLGNR
jgi:hypothetical protein